MHKCVVIQQFYFKKNVTRGVYSGLLAQRCMRLSHLGVVRLHAKCMNGGRINRCMKYECNYRHIQNSNYQRYTDKSPNERAQHSSQSSVQVSAQHTFTVTFQSSVRVREREESASRNCLSYIVAVTAASDRRAVTSRPPGRRSANQLTITKAGQPIS